MATESQDAYRDLVESLGALFWEADPETLRFKAVSPSAEALLGYPRSAWTSTPTFWAEILHPDDLERALVTRALAIKRCEDYRIDYRVITLDGRTLWIRDTARLKCEGGQLKEIRGVMIDVTASQEQQNSTFDEAPIGIAHTSLEGVWLRVNRHFCALLGYAPEELMATSFMAITHPDDVEQDRRAITQLLAGAIRRYEREKRYRHKNGHFVFTKLTAVLHRDRAGAPAYFISTIEDLTDRDAMEGQLRQSQRMEAVGRLAGGIAHDFNNLLTVIVGYAELVLRQLDPGTPLQRDVAEIRRAGINAAALVRQLLAFGHKGTLQPQILDVNEVVFRMNGLLRRLIDENVVLATELATHLDLVLADPGQVEQIILNLALNARDAMPEGGRLTIETANVELDAQWVAQHPGASEGHYVRLVITDTGMGMDGTVQAKLFEPFFTTKERGRGTGLGLATVYGIVKQNGGSIFVDSRPGYGSTFTIFLPRTEQSADSSKAARLATQAPGGAEAILLVEDQPEVRGVIADTLVRHGYDVLVAANGVEALSILERHEGDVHLLVTDIVMPGMSGRDLAERLVAARPDLRVLYMSGYTDDVITRHGVVLETGMAFLQKPFTPNLLLQTVRDILDRA